MERIAIAAVELLGERLDEAFALPLREQRDVEHDREVLARDHLGHDLAAGRLKRDVSTVAAEHCDRIASRLAVSAGAKT
jgi:hypothetical protein